MSLGGVRAAARRLRRGGRATPRLVGVIVVLVSIAAPAQSAFAGGQLLVYTGNGGINEGYSQFATAAGRTVTTSPTLPLTDGEWDSYACVLLPVSTVGYTLSQRTAFNSYMARGGTVVAIAEHLNADPSQVVGPASVTTFNNLASSTGIQALNTSRNQGPTVTTNVPASKYTTSVTKVGFAATTTLTVTSPAITLVRTVKDQIVDPDPAPFIAVREEGDNGGKFVYSGDSNVFSDGGGGRYAGNDNDKLARNICGDINPPVITITTPQDGAHFKKGQVLPAAWTCTDADSDVNAALTTATTPVGQPIDTTVLAGQSALKSYTVSCTDNAGNAATKTVSYTVDDTPPTVVIDTPIDGGTVNRGSNIPSSWHCQDPDGPANIDTAPDKTFGTVADGDPIDTVMPLGGPPIQKTFSVTCTDKAGNTATKTVTYTVADQNPPVATISTPLDGARFTIGKIVTADWACTDPDGPQDIDPDENKTFGTTLDGQPVDTTGVVGQTIAKSYSVTCTDLAGNTTTKTNTYYIDGNPPIVTIAVPVDGGTYQRGSNQLANWSCTDPDGAADVKTEVATTPVGTAINTSTSGSKSFSVTCTDQAGNSATRTVSYTVSDTNPPAITITAPADGARYRQGQVVNPNYACTDVDGAADVKSCTRAGGATGPIDTSTPGTKSFTVNAEDLSGNTSTNTVHYVVDASAPQISITSPADGARFQQDQVVLADYACSDVDGQQDVASCAGDVADGDELDTSTPGTKSFTVDAQDPAGNPATKTVHYFVDASAPDITLIVPADGAVYSRGSTVAADYSCADDDGVADVKTCSGPVADGVAIDTGTVGGKSFMVDAVDQAGNESSTTVHYTVIDSRAPDISIASPVDGARFALGQIVAADYQCISEDGPSDVKACTGTVADGANLDTSTAGSKVFTVNSEDQAGNKRSKTVQYVVDGGAPSISVSVPAEGGTYARGAVVLASYGCTDDDGPADIASCVGSVASGVGIDTATVGSKTFKIAASDKVGNTSSKIVTYTVIETALPPLAGPASTPKPLVPTLGSVTASGGGTIGLTFTIPSGGRLAIDATTSTTGAARKLTYAKLTRTVRAGVVNVTLRPTRTAKRLLARKKRLKVKVRAVFVPTDGDKRTSLNRVVTVKSNGSSR